MDYLILLYLGKKRIILFTYFYLRLYRFLDAYIVLMHMWYGCTLIHVWMQLLRQITVMHLCKVATENVIIFIAISGLKHLYAWVGVWCGEYSSQKRPENSKLLRKSRVDEIVSTQINIKHVQALQKWSLKIFPQRKDNFEFAKRTKLLWLEREKKGKNF
jgi:hypothetical protein